MVRDSRRFELNYDLSVLPKTAITNRHKCRKSRKNRKNRKRRFDTHHSQREQGQDARSKLEDERHSMLHLLTSF